MHAPEDRNDEIDLAPYAAVILRHWKLILAICSVVLLTVVVATVAIERVAPRYQAQADLILTGSRYRLTLDPKFATTESLQGQPGAPLGSRVDEYKSIAGSADIRASVTQSLLAQGHDDDARWLTPTITVKGTLVTVMVTADTPERAARLADLYAKAVATRLDVVYGQSEHDIDTLRTNLQEAVAAHQAAESQLTIFTRENRTDLLAGQLARRQAVMASLRAASLDMVRSRLENVGAALDESEALVQSGTRLSLQVRESDPSPASRLSASLTLMSLQRRLVALSTAGKSDRPVAAASGTPAAVGQASGRPSENVQLHVGADALGGDPTTQAQLVSDVDAFVAAARASHQDLQATRDALYQRLTLATDGAVPDFVQPDQWITTSIERLNDEVNDLQAQLRQEAFRQETLSRNVDLAKTVRVTLETKLREAEVAAESGSRVIVSSGTGGTAGQSWPPPLTRTLPLSALAALMLGGVAAFAAERIGRRRSAAVADAASPVNESALAAF